MKRKSIPLILAVMALVATATAQNSTLRYLLPERVVDEMIGRASGETALNHIIEMGGYIHDRPLTEYTEITLESAYVYGRIKEYGLEGAEVKRYPAGTTWDGVSGSVWEISPGRTKIADFFDLNAMLAEGSLPADVTTELVWVGEGTKADFDKSDVEGKIVVTSGSISVVNSIGTQRGAAGIISFNSPRPLQVPLAIPITGLAGWGRQVSGSSTFGFFLPPREGHLLRDRLLAGEKIIVHAVVESQMVEYQHEVPTCYIPGSDPDADEIIFSAHLFEGLVKQGANDNISGSAAILEIARMLKVMIDNGIIERPKRTIRFLWIPEFAGTGPFVTENRELMKRTLCNINLDMVGINLAANQSFLCLHRTTFGNRHYINDVMENFYHFVGLGNRAGLAITARGGFMKRIVAPTGSDDPFYYRIDDHYGSSDHEVFNDWGVGVPGVMMITWPDLYYHTSQDLADKCDATQLKRVCFIGAATAYAIASADDAMAARIASEITSNAAGRIGQQLERATDLVDRSDSESFVSAYRLGRSYIEATVMNEVATIFTTLELAKEKKSFTAFLNEQKGAIEANGRAALNAFESFMRQKAAALGRPVAAVSRPTALEAQAAATYPKETPAVKEKGYRGHSQMLFNLDRSVMEKYPFNMRNLDTQELARLCTGSHSALDIKKLLDTQRKEGETDLQEVVNYIGLLNELGLVTVTKKR